MEAATALSTFSSEAMDWHSSLRDVAALRSSTLGSFRRRNFIRSEPLRRISARSDSRRTKLSAGELAGPSAGQRMELETGRREARGALLVGEGEEVGEAC